MTFSLAFLALQLVCLFLCYAFLLHSQSHPQLWLLVLCVFFFLQHLIWKCFATNSMSYSVEQLALVMTKCIKHIFTCSISNDCSPWISWMLCWGRIWFEQPESGWCIEISISFRYGTTMQNLKILNLDGIKMWWEQECSTWCTYLLICYCTNPWQHGICLFYMTKRKVLLMVMSSVHLSSNRSWERTAQNAGIIQLTCII